MKIKLQTNHTETLQQWAPELYYFRSQLPYIDAGRNQFAAGFFDVNDHTRSLALFVTKDHVTPYLNARVSQ